MSDDADPRDAALREIAKIAGQLHFLWSSKEARSGGHPMTAATELGMAAIVYLAVRGQEDGASDLAATARFALARARGRVT